MTLSNGVMKGSSLKQLFTKVWARLRGTSKERCSVPSQKQQADAITQPEQWQEGGVPALWEKVCLERVAVRSCDFRQRVTAYPQKLCRGRARRPRTAASFSFHPQSSDGASHCPNLIKSQRSRQLIQVIFKESSIEKDTECFWKSKCKVLNKLSHIKAWVD